MHSSHLGRGEVCSTSSRAEYLHKLLGILLGKFVSSPPFINLLNNLYQYGLVDVCFILCAVFQYYFNNFIVLIVPALAFRSSFNWLLCPLVRLPIIVGDFCLFCFEQ